MLLHGNSHDILRNSICSLQISHSKLNHVTLMHYIVAPLNLSDQCFPDHYFWYACIFQFDGCLQLTEVMWLLSNWNVQIYKKIIKGEFRDQHKLGSNERALNFQKKQPSLTFIRQLVLEISRLKVKNMDVAIFLISSLIFV